MDNLRYVEICEEDGVWRPVTLQEVKKGQSFRMFEEGKPVEDDSKESVFVAKKDAVFNEEAGVWTIDI